MHKHISDTAKFGDLTAARASSTNACARKCARSSRKSAAGRFAREWIRERVGRRHHQRLLKADMD
jgi:ketol-acid reductoisomerase